MGGGLGRQRRGGVIIVIFILEEWGGFSIRRLALFNAESTEVLEVAVKVFITIIPFSYVHCKLKINNNYS